MADPGPERAIAILNVLQGEQQRPPNNWAASPERASGCSAPQADRCPSCRPARRLGVRARGTGAFMGLFRRRARRPIDRTAYPPARMPRSPGGRFGFWGPIPYYSLRNRRGAEVSVGGCGCCLPIPLLIVTGTVGGVWTLVRRWRRA